MSDEDTQAFNPFDEPADTAPAKPVAYSEVEDEDDEIELPKAALVRPVLLAVVSFIGAVLGKQLNVAWVDAALDLYLIAGPAALAWWVHRKTKAAGAPPEKT